MGDNATSVGRMFSAFDSVTVVQSNTDAALVVGVGLVLAFLGYKLIKRISGKI